MKSKLPRPLDLAIKRLAQEQARAFYANARKLLEREALEAVRGGAAPDAVTAQMLQRMVRASVAEIAAGVGRRSPATTAGIRQLAGTRSSG